MDTDLFQILTLALLAVNLVVLLLVLSTLNKTRSQPETSAVLTGSASYPAYQTGSYQPAPTSSYEVPTTTAPAAGTPASSYGEPTGYEPATAGAYEVPGAEEPVVSETVTTPAAAVAATAHPGGAAEAMPEEQPFERDGRWWFKRGDELLVYDEGTGQWTPAPAGTMAATPSVATPTTLSDVAATTPTTAQPAAGAEPSGGFWKCPSCGAINGSTADSCRMCFTSRP